MIYFPTIKIKPIIQSAKLNEAINRFDKFNFIVFTSQNAVEVFINLKIDYELDLSKLQIAAVGVSSAEKCLSNGIRVDIIPVEFSSQGLIREFSKIDMKGKKILIPCSSLSKKDLQLGLTQLGADVTSIPIYDVEINDLSLLEEEYQEILRNIPDVFVFTSPSSFHSYLKIMNIMNAKNYFGNSIICTIGKTTETAIQDYDINVQIVPENYSLKNVEEAIRKYFIVTSNIA
jgi:uroporphyrinogen-III synthase